MFFEFDQCELVCRDLDQLHSRHQLLFSRVGLVHALTQDDHSFDVVLSVNETDRAIFAALRSNSTSVFLHVLLLLHSDDQHHKKSRGVRAITADMLRSGQTLSGVVRLVKHDRIPKHFLHRHLLSDFGLVQVSDIDRE
jgi:hypothetical protein